MALSDGIICGEDIVYQEEFESRVRCAASGFNKLGVRSGDAVVLLLRNDMSFIEASHALSMLGAYAVPVNWHFTEEEVAYILGDCQARLLVAHSDIINKFESSFSDGIDVVIVPTPPSIKKLYQLPESDCEVVSVGHASSTLLWESIYSDRLADDIQLPENPMTIIYTSGTTGKPKGVVRKPSAKKNEAMTRANREQVYGIKPGVRALVPGPLYHSAPNSFGLIAASNAECFVIMQKFDAEELLRLIDRHKITTVFAVPTMFVRLLELPKDVRERYDLSSLNFVIHGAAPCAPDVKREMIEWFGPIINEFYGATEIGLFTLCSSNDWLKKPGTVGRAIDGIDIKILDEEGVQVPVMEHGEIYIHNPLFPDFTYHNRETDRKAVEKDGMISCGDIGYFDQDGYLFICDRKKDMVISGGVNIYPAETEGALVALPEVSDCAVFGVPDDEFGERLIAFIKLQDGAAANKKSIKQQLNERLANYKVPRDIEFVKDMPRDDSGKIFKRKLRDPYWNNKSQKV